LQEKDDQACAAFEILRVSAVQPPSDWRSCHNMITFARFEIDSRAQTLLAATETSISNFASGSKATQRLGDLCSVPCEHHEWDYGSTAWRLLTVYAGVFGTSMMSRLWWGCCVLFGVILLTIQLHIVEIQVHLKVKNRSIAVLFVVILYHRTCTSAQKIRSITEITFAREIWCRSEVLCNSSRQTMSKSKWAVGRRIKRWEWHCVLAAEKMAMILIMIIAAGGECGYVSNKLFHINRYFLNFQERISWVKGWVIAECFRARSERTTIVKEAVPAEKRVKQTKT
jgi:hypothetical protein